MISKIIDYLMGVSGRIHLGTDLYDRSRALSKEPTFSTPGLALPDYHFPRQHVDADSDSDRDHACYADLLSPRL